MTVVYQHDADGYFVGKTEAYGGLLPHGCLNEAPEEAEDCIPRFNGLEWELVENHKGKKGFLPDGSACEITAYGPLPEGWSETPPLPSAAQAAQQARDALRARRKSVEYGGFEVDGLRWDSEEKDELRLNSAGRLFDGGIPALEGWKIAEGSYITLTPEILAVASAALMAHYGRAFAVEAAKLAEIAALEAVGDVEMILAWIETDLPLGW